MDIDIIDRNGFGTGNLAVAVVEIDIIVAAGLHFREGKLKLFLSQMIDIDQLGVVLGKFAGDNVRERVGRIERRQDRNPEQNRVMPV